MDGWMRRKTRIITLRYASLVKCFLEPFPLKSKWKTLVGEWPSNGPDRPELVMRWWACQDFSINILVFFDLFVSSTRQPCYYDFLTRKLLDRPLLFSCRFHWRGHTKNWNLFPFGVVAVVAVCLKVHSHANVFLIVIFFPSVSPTFRFVPITWLVFFPFGSSCRGESMAGVSVHFDGHQEIPPDPN